MRLFIFDMGSVLVTGLHILAGMADELGVDRDTLKNDYWVYDRAVMDGWMTEEDYYRHLELRFGKKVEGKLFLRHFTPVVNERLVGIIKKLKAKGYRLVVGSNTFSEHWEYMLDWEDSPFYLFDSLYASYLIHRSKPEPYFFQHILSEEGVPCSEASFIDDRADNVAAARSLGIRSLLYSGEGLEEREKEFFSPYL